MQMILPSTDDIQMFCYTSGTTGDSKAAMLSNKNFMSAASALLMVPGLKISENDTLVSYLPLAHAYEKVICCTGILVGAEIGYYSGDTLQLLSDVQELKPTFFPSVPRLFNKIYDKINRSLKEKT